MTEEKKDSSIITREQLLEFMAAKKFAKICTNCSVESNWDILGIDEGLFHPFLFSNSSNILNGKYVPCYSLTCENCGYARIFFKETIVNWFKSEKEAKLL